MVNTWAAKCGTREIIFPHSYNLEVKKSFDSSFSTCSVCLFLDETRSLTYEPYYEMLSSPSDIFLEIELLRRFDSAYRAPILGSVKRATYDYPFLLLKSRFFMSDFTILKIYSRKEVVL